MLPGMDSNPLGGGLVKNTAIATLCAAFCLTAAGPAAASSIVYIKDHNVWVASPDGSKQHQVTTDGEPDWRYGSPSQADDGTIVAARGDEIVRLKQSGEVLSKFDPPATTDSAGQHIDGIPVDVAVSPDGTKVAYTYIQANCPVGVSCGARSVTMYSHADRATDPEEFGKLYRRNPSWVTNTRTLVFNGYQHQVNLDDFGGGRDSDVHWFDDEDVFGQESSTDLGDGELSPQGDRLAILRGYGDSTQLSFYAVSGDVKNGPPPAAPTPACTTGAEPTLNSPTWSPDGKTIAFEHKDGIETIALPTVAPDDCSGASSGTVVIPGGREPDFGPADVNPGPPPCVNHCDYPPPCHTCPPDDPDQPGELLVGAQKPVKASTAAKKGIRIKVTVPGAGRLTGSLKLGKSKLASGVTTTPGAGPATLTIRLSKKAAARLRKAKKLSLALRYDPVESGAVLEKSLSLKVTK
jgi:hypothetical protein